MNSFRLTLSLLAPFALAFASLAVVASPASAASAICQKQYSGYSRVPATSVIGSTDCHMYKTYGGAEAVRAFQRSYNWCYARVHGWSYIDTDGIYGSETAGAVTNVQTHHHIFRDGKYGPQTKSVMDFMYGEANGISFHCEGA